MRFSYLQPGNEDEFEEFCLRFYRRYLKRGSLTRYGKRGERQDGIDLIDQLGIKPVTVIQCKHHEPHKTLPPKKDIKDEVAKAELSSHDIDHYIIATTGRRTTNAHDTVINLNKREDKKFTVEIHYWDDICSFLQQLGKADAELILLGEPSQDDAFEPQPVATQSHLTHLLPPDGIGADEMFPDIIALFKDRKLEAADHEINKLPNPETDETICKERKYALLRLRAKLAMEQLRFEEGCRLFLLAYDTCPELEQAKLNRVLALEFSGKQQEALAEAKELVEEGTKSEFLVTILTRNALDEVQLSEYGDLIEEYRATSEEVNVELVQRYLKWNNLEQAKAAAEQAREIAPNSAHAMFANGMVAHHDALQGDWRTRTDNLAAARKFYTEAIDAAARDNYKGLLPEIYINRGRINAVAGDFDAGANDFRRAIEVASKPELYAQGAVSMFLNFEEFDLAWELLPQLDETSDEAQFLIAATEYHHAPRDEKREFITRMAALGDKDNDRAIEARFHSVHWAIQLKDFELAKSCVPDSFVEKNPFQGNALRGWIFLEEGDEKGCRESTELALESSSSSANKQEIAVLARLLVRLGEDEKALPLWEQAATPGVLDYDCKSLIECARRLDRQDVLIRICGELRETGQQDNLVRKLEVQLLSHYLPQKAFELAREFRAYDERYFTAASNYLAMKLGLLDQMEFDIAKLPTPDDICPDEAYLVVTPYAEAKRYRDALLFLYSQLRKRFSEEMAHGQYLWFVSQYGSNAGLDTPTRVDEKSAVRLKDTRTGEERWVIVEDNNPTTERHEFSLASPIVQELLGKRIGDLISLPVASIQPVQEKIVEIQSKYVRAFQDCFSNFQTRFPGASSIQKVHLGNEDDLDLSPLIESLKERHEHVKEVAEFYNNNLCSLFFFASRLGVNELQLMQAAMYYEDWMIRCSEITAEDFASAVRKGIASKKVVLDITAIITIAELDAWSLLNTDIEYFVSRSTMDVISEWQHDLSEDANQAKGHSSLTSDGKLEFRDVTPEEMQRRRDELEKIRSQLQSTCTVKNSIAVSSLDPKRRDAYIKTVGFHTLEAVSVANDEKAILWTDDLFVAHMAQVEYGVQRVWTQLMLRINTDASLIERSSYSEITAKLASWNYVAIVWNPEELVTAGELCNWNVEEWPLNQCIKLIGKCPLPLPQKTRLAVDFFRLLRRSTCSELRQSPIVHATLDAIGSTQAAEWLLRRLDQFFSIDYPSAEFLKAQVRYWLRVR